jgi:endoglucanase
VTASAAVVCGLALAVVLGPVERSSGSGAHPEPGSAFIRLDQVGYATTAPGKRAYLMASGDESGATFAVRDARGRTVLHGAIGARLGRWSARYPDVYAIDLPLERPGRFELSVDAPIAAPAVPLRIASGDALDGTPLANGLAFFEEQRDGPDYVPSALRMAPGHLNDADAMTYATPSTDENGGFRGDLRALGRRIDASGGWWDAGDYLKFVETESYTSSVLLLGVRDFPHEMGSQAPTDYAGEARFGVDWLLRMWDDASGTLYYQVGIGEGNAATVGDHDIWRLPQVDDTYGGNDPRFRYIRNRPVFRAGPPGSPVSPNLAGRDAAAFALCFQDFRTSHPDLAARCLRAAEHVYALADTSPGHLMTVIPYGFYPETEWRDDLELGATEIARALMAGPPPPGLAHTDPGPYVADAARWARAYIDGPNDAKDPLNLYDVSGLADYELARALDQAGDPSGLAVTRADLVADLGKQLDLALAQAAHDPFGFGVPWNTWDTTSHGDGLSVVASEYDQLTGTTRYAAESSRWLANVLGANAFGLSLIVGDGTTFPHCLQHQVANLAGSLDGSPPVLRGAAVEGVNGQGAGGKVAGMRACPVDGVNPYAPFRSTAMFRDDVRSYPNTEPAHDLTATSPLAFARQAAGLY